MDSQNIFQRIIHCNCFHWVLNSYYSVPVLALGVILGVLVGIAGLNATKLVWDATTEKDLILKKVELIQSPSKGIPRRLIVDLYAPLVKNCVRFSHHALYRIDTETNQKIWQPLNMALSSPELLSTPDLEVNLSIPESTAPGNWLYIDRSIYLCTIFGFMITDTTFTKPYPVHLDPIPSTSDPLKINITP